MSPRTLPVSACIVSEISLGVVEHPVAQLAEPVVAALDPDRLPLGLVGAHAGDGRGDRLRRSRPRSCRSRSPVAGLRTSIRSAAASPLAPFAVPFVRRARLGRAALHWVLPSVDPLAGQPRVAARPLSAATRDEAVDRAFERGDVDVAARRLRRRRWGWRPRGRACGRRWPAAGGGRGCAARPRRSRRRRSACRASGRPRSPTT